MLNKFILLPAIFVTAACGSANLDRELAAELILQSQEMSERRTQVVPQSNALELAISQGIVLSYDRDPILAENVQSEIDQIGDGKISLTSATPIEVEVTGITESDDSAAPRRVAFTWRYTDLPKYTRRLAILGGTGSGIARRFDDGWRIADLTIQNDATVYPLQNIDLNQWEEDREAELARRTNVNNRFRQSWTSSEVLYEYSSNNYCTSGQEIIITDVDIKFTSNCGNGNWSKIWLGHIRNITSSDMYIRISPRIGGNYSIRIDPQDVDDVLNALRPAIASWESEHGIPAFPIQLLYRCEVWENADNCRQFERDYAS